jgi:flagellar protein FliS
MNNPRAAYMGNSVTTASPSRLLVMLYDRLVLDVQRAVEAQKNGDFVAAGQQLVHAQDIVLELNSSLKQDLWEGAAQLASIYTWLHSELVKANVSRDVTVTEGCLGIVTELADAWRQAALTAAAAG